MDAKKWFKQAKFGMMVHWGLYSLLGGEWQGKSCEFAEWIQHKYKIPYKEYEKLVHTFNPLYFNAEDWVKMAKEVGAEYFVVTAKHHDGFALFHSKVDKFNIVDATPFKRDVISEIAEACYKYNLKLGLYYSQEIDWHEPDGAGQIWLPDKNLKETVYWENDWDFPDRNKKDYTRCLNSKILPQVKELLTNYGDLCLIWFDTPGQIKPEHSKMLFDLVKRYQPNCLVNSRIGNDMGDYIALSDNEITDKDMTTVLAESPITLSSSWGHKFSDEYKSADTVFNIINQLNSKGVNCLLNVGPDSLGRIPAAAVNVLKKLKERKVKGDVL